MASLNIIEGHLIEKFVLGHGRGGQKIQKTKSCVYLKHIPSGIEIKCQKTRFREDNRYFARRRLADKLETLMFEEQSLEKQEAEKIRRQKKRRRKRAKDKIKDQKHQLKKDARKPVDLNKEV